MLIQTSIAIVSDGSDVIGKNCLRIFHGDISKICINTSWVNGKEMRILILNHTAKMVGGAETYVKIIIDGLKERGHEVILFSGDDYLSAGNVANRFFNTRAYHRLLALIDEFHPDIVHLNNVFSSFSTSVLFACKKRGIPIIMTVHDYALVCPECNLIFQDGRICEIGFSRKCMFSQCYSSASDFFGMRLKSYDYLKCFLNREATKRTVYCAISPSESVANYLRKNLNFSNVVTIPNCIDVQDSPSPELGDSPNLLFVGRITYEKGLQVLLRAMVEVRHQIANAHLDIVGTGPYEQTAKNLSVELGIQDSVTFHSRVPCLDTYYRQTKATIVPSIWAENQPYVVLESMSYGRPIIASRSFGLKDLVTDEIGVLFNHNDSHDLAVSIIKFLVDVDDARKKSIACSTIAREKYSTKKYFDRLLEIYSEAGSE